MSRLRRRNHPFRLKLLLAAGFSGHGFQHAPIVGKVLSEIALGAPPTVDVGPLRLERFAEGHVRRRVLAAEAFTAGAIVGALVAATLRSIRRDARQRRRTKAR